jgi:hypothetical protein
MVSPHTFSRLVLCWIGAAALGCATYSEPALESEHWAEDVKSQASRAADATARGAAAASEAMGTAYQGVRNGFQPPDADGYGAFPRDHAAAIRRHMQHFENVPATASFRFGRPEKGYVNKGVLAGGGVAWQGYLVEVEVLAKVLFASQTEPNRYVVRMRDGDVVEVLEADYADALRWAEREARPMAGVAARAED